jgi:CDP-paratose synthetase
MKPKTKTAHHPLRRLLLTGATGFLGSHLVRHFLDRGHHVAILKRGGSDTRRIDTVLPQVAAYDVDRLTLDDFFRVAGPFDAVIHAATCYGRRNESRTDMVEANVVFPLRLLESAANHSTRLFINSSSALPRRLNAYSLSKDQFTEWGAACGRNKTIRFVNIRLDHLYGPGDDSGKFPSFIVHSCLKNVPELRLTAGEQKRDFIFIADVQSAFETLLDSQIDKMPGFVSYDVASGRPVRIRRFVETIKRLTGSTTMLHFGAVPYRPHELMQTRLDIGPMRRLGWAPRYGLKQGLEITVRHENLLFREGVHACDS